MMSIHNSCFTQAQELRLDNQHLTVNKTQTDQQRREEKRREEKRREEKRSNGLSLLC